MLDSFEEVLSIACLLQAFSKSDMKMCLYPLEITSCFSRPQFAASA